MWPLYLTAHIFCHVLVIYVPFQCCRRRSAGVQNGSQQCTANASNVPMPVGIQYFLLFHLLCIYIDCLDCRPFPHDMQPNASCHKCPILPLYRLTNLSTDSPNTLTSFIWLQAHNHSLTFTLWFVHDVHIRLTSTRVLLLR
jgi:hypothetical protein